MARITKSYVDSTEPKGSDYFVWDDDLPGFGLRVYPSGKRSYFAQYRIGRKTHRLKLGVHGPITPDEARKLAKKALGAAALGQNPALESKKLRDDIDVTELCDRYLSDGCATKKASTLATDRGRIERHIKPLLGKMPVRALQKADIEKFLKDVATGRTAADVRTKSRGRARVRGGKGAATRTVGLLGAVFTFACNAGLRPDNPVRGVRRYKDRRLERFLTIDELKRLGLALQAAEARDETPSAIAAIRLLALTGCRRGEILSLRWSDVNWAAACIVLRDSKTGHKIVPLGRAAIELLQARYAGTDRGYVLAGEGMDHFKEIQKTWDRIRKAADLEGVRLHDLRHTFVSVGVGGGLNLTVMGRIVGHRSTETTARYAHLERSLLHDAADRVAEVIATPLLVRPSAVSKSDQETEHVHALN